MLTDFRTVALAGAGVSALLGSRLRPIRRDQTDPLPAAALNVISRGDDVTMSGPSGYIATRVQVDVYGITYTDARAAADALIARLHGFAGTQDATVFQGVMLDNESSGFEAGDTEQDRLARIRLDFMVHHGRAAS